jgi:hypothetical protein
MTRRYVSVALAYAAVAMAGGVFFREFTKFRGFTGETTLSVVHTHYFTLGMLFFLMLAMLDRMFGFSDGRHAGLFVVSYHVGLNVTGAALLLRGIAQATGAALSRGMDASLSGFAGLGHILLGVSMLAILFSIRGRLDR